ncbi:TetR/AcrR family transcriptional regulator [Devosia nitrariae]|uniref:TetR family transcriptional regulator n=1 Tax=Devosia nitrariae TaxID=2071872 RepID=A0ABQ5VYD0_9HYPH|nr:TetR/AcrR family transcriptional regulator [Devosia nitrariae]GLQ52817.1 TetR family transcriptional regulator [Devosia nitrariae]
MAIDRRVARTRETLFEALLELIRHKDYDAITVADILQQADVGRSTFYAHFSSKDDLLERSLERLRALLLSAAEAGGRDPTRALFEHVAEFGDIQFALAGGRGAAVVREAVDEVLAGVLRRVLPVRGFGGFPRELAVRHMVSTFNTVLLWWLDQKMQAPAGDVDAYFRRLVLEGLPGEACAPFVSEGLESETPQV